MSEETRRTWIVDSVEEGVAAVEEDGRRLVNVPRWLLPDDARGGDVLEVRRAGSAGGCTVHLRVDRDATDAARRREAARPPPPSDGGGPIVL